jgi:fimbrial isopeptide formation D2 family protein/uncharacterized repeat protein (TIGR01451 family)
LVSYQAILDITAPEAQTFLNTATVDYDSLPGDPVDENGDPVDDRDYSAEDDYSVATVPFLLKTPITSSFAETDSELGSDPFDLAIGETVTYSYDLYLPEIDMDEVLFTDNLPTGMDFVSFNLVSYGLGMTDTSGGALGTPLLSVVGNDITLDFGDIRNPEDTDPPTIGPDDFIRIEVVGRINSDMSAGDTLTNVATLAVDPTDDVPLDVAVAEADVRVVEPELTIDKTGPIALDPGDTGTFVVTFGNTGPDVDPDATGPAYDVSVSDVLPAGMTLDTGSIVITLDGAAYTPGPGELVATPTGFTFGMDLLLPQEKVVITYDVTLDAAVDALGVFVNDVTASYDSAPGDDPNQEVYEPVTEGHSVGTRPTLEKSTLTSQFTQTPEDNDGDMIQDLSIGEVVTYELVLTLPEFPMETVELTDALPAGLTFVDAVITELGSTITVNGSASLTDANSAAVVSEMGQTMTLMLNDVLNSGSDGTGTRADDAIVVQITARIDDVAGNTGFAPNTQLTNTAGLTVTPDGEPALDEVTDSAVVELVEPNLTLAKTSTDAVSPGETVDYEIVIENTGTGPAFDLVIADAFADTNLNLVPGSVTFSFGGFTQSDVAVTESAGGFSFEFDDTATGDPIPVQAGETLIVTYQATLSEDAPLAQSFVNTASVDYDSAPGDPVDENGDPIDDRDYGTEDTAVVATAPGLVKTPITSNFAETDSELGSNPFDLAIGEEVTFAYSLSLPEIGMESVIFTDNLPTGMDFLSFDNVTFGTGLTDLAGGVLSAPVFTSTGPNDFTLDFGGILNPAEDFPPTLGADDIITFTVTGRVNTDMGAGDTLTNTATLTVDPDGATGPLETTVVESDVRVVEPELSIDKTGPSALDPGDVGAYTVAVGNTGPAVTPDATGPAYDVTIADVMPAELTLDPGSVAITLNGVAYTPGAGELTATGTGFSLNFDVLMPGDEVVISYNATLDPATDALTSVFNTASAEYDSAPGEVLDDNGDPIEQTYDPVVDDHRLSSQPTLSKTDIASGYAETPEDGDGDGIRGLAVGEEVTYELVLTLPEIDMGTVVLTDLLPTGLDFVSASVVDVGTEITINGVTDISNAGQLLTVTFDDLTNTYVDGTITQDQDAIIIEVVARVSNIDSNVEDTQLTNIAGLIVTPVGEDAFDEIIDTATVEVIEPSLVIDKSTTTIEPFLGDIIVYTVVITNEDTATSPAFNSVITDALPGDLELTGVISLSDPALGSVSPTSIAGSTTLIINIPVLQPGESLTIEYEAFVDYTTNVLEPIANTATSTSTSTPDVDNPFDRDYGVEDDAIIVPRPVPEDPEDAGPKAIDGIDDEQFLRVLQIDPIFTGTAEPGANVTINLYNQMGGLDYVRNIVSDTGGHWIAIFPRVELDAVEDDFHEFHATSLLFDAPVKLLDRANVDTMGYAQNGRHFAIGSQLEDEAYTLGINVDRPSTLPQESGIFNTRTFFAPANIGEIYGRQESVRVDEVFDSLAFNTVKDLYQSSVDPLGTSMNRFNYEFLSGSTAVPGQQ